MIRLRSRAWTVLATVALSLAVTACTSGNAQTSPTSAQASELVNKPISQFSGFGLDPAQPRPNFILKDAANQLVNFGTVTAGRPTLLFFGYTHCVDECPTTMADIHIALTEVPAAVRAKTLVVFVTTDPKNDDSATITKWLTKFNEGLDPAQFIGLTGTQAQIDAAQAASKIPIAEDGGETHSTVVLLYGPDDYAHVSFALSDTEQEQMQHDLPIVAAM